MNLPEPVSEIEPALTELETRLRELDHVYVRLVLDDDSRVEGRVLSAGPTLVSLSGSGGERRVEPRSIRAIDLAVAVPFREFLIALLAIAAGTAAMTFYSTRPWADGESAADAFGVLASVAVGVWFLLLRWPRFRAWLTRWTPLLREPASTEQKEQP